MNCIRERSHLTYYLLSFFTLGIYSLVFWAKVGKNTNALCEGDGKKTMKFIYVLLLSVVTLGIYGLVWRYQLAKRLKENAERYDLTFKKGGAFVVVFTILGVVIADYVLIKHFNKMAKAYNDYNGLVDPGAEKINLFADED